MLVVASNNGKLIIQLEWPNPATFDIKGLCTSSQVFQPYLAFYIKRLGVAINLATALAFQYWCLAYTLVYYHRFYPLK